MTEMLHHWVSGEANRRSDATAVVLGEERLSYGELEILSNQLARALKERGCVRGDRVCLLLPKSPLALVCLLGIYKADCVYVPLDPAAPATILAQVIIASECRGLLAAASLAPRVRELLSQPGLPALRIGWLGSPDQSPGPLPVAFRFSDIGTLPGIPLHGAHRAHDTAHILFHPTAGGSLRGVTATHANVVSFVEWARKYFRLNATDRVAGHARFNQGLSLLDIFGSFSSGAELHLVPPDGQLPSNRLMGWIRASGITHWSSGSLVLSTMAKLDAVQPWDFPQLRRVLWNGEVLPTAVLSYWMKQLPHVEFTNLYGSAEAAVAGACHTVVSFPADEAEQIPLGRACGGVELLVLDHNLQPASAGVVGDIYIRGASLSPGYWRDSEATARAFPNIAGLGRVYRTGDRGLRGHDGLVYPAGRDGDSVQSGGRRIEFGRIEDALNRVDAVSECAVVAVPGHGTDAVCCAYVPKADDEITPDGLRDHLGKLVPDYMIPSRWRAWDELPKNAAGRIDRLRLKETWTRDGIDPA
ncbi:MAG TPA: AMP-binding protein [Gammaproteobacteria bacterium]|jgi:amino acid adenylation domain-containing protein|nr:AMP-binding protein [Gammaproteobacteria bacterium]